MDFSAIALRIGTLGGQQAVAALDQIDRKAQQTAKQVNDIFDNTLYKGSLRDAEADYQKLVTAWKTGSDQAAVAVNNVSTKISGLGTRLQSLAATGSIMGATLAEGGAYGVTRFARSIANLGFAVNPVVGGITILAATVGTALFEAFEKSKKEAEAFRKSLTDLINAGQTARIGEKIYDVEVGTAAENYEDGLVALKAKLATVEARFKEMHLGGQSAQILELQGKIATAQSKLDELVRAQQLAMRSSAYYDRLNEEGTRADAKTAKDALKVPNAEAFESPGVDAINKEREAYIKALDKQNREIVAAMKKNHEEYVKTYDRLNKELGKKIKAVTAKENPLLAAGKEIADRIDEMNKRIARTIQDGLTSTLVNAMRAGVETAFKGGGVGAIFASMGKAVLAGLGSMFVQIGEAALAGMALMAKIKAAIISWAPEIGIPVALALIAAGSLMQAAGAGSGGRGGGGGGGGGYGGNYSYGSVSAPAIVVPPPAGAPAHSGDVSPRQPIQITVIGKDDPSVQRQMLELIARAQRRGTTNG